MIGLLSFKGWDSKDKTRIFAIAPPKTNAFDKGTQSSSGN